MLKDVNSGPTLMVPHGASSLWVWAAWKTQEHTDTRLKLTDAPGVHATVGSATRGLHGFRASHHEAAAAAELIRTSLTAMPGQASIAGSANVTHYIDVELVVLLTQNPTLAATFISRELGPAADETPSNRELRETVAAYLTYDRSLAKAADHLHVARNIVAYRVKKFETITGRDLKQRRLELEVALRLASTSPGAPK